MDVDDDDGGSVAAAAIVDILQRRLVGRSADQYPSNPLPAPYAHGAVDRIYLHL